MQTAVNDLTVLFLSILLEALPFVVLSCLIASAISLYVSDDLLYRLIPKNRIGGLLVASLLGIVFPVCDCTIIPIMRRLISKGLPPSLAVTFMCAVPIVNPAVMASTYWAFTNQPHVIWLRLIVGMTTAIVAGFTIGKLTRDANPLRNDRSKKAHSSHDGCSCGNDSDHSKGCDHQHDNRALNNNRAAPAWNRVSDGVHNFLTHTANEFIDNSALIVIGAFLSAAIQILIPRTIMYPVSSSPAASVGVMMGFTWLISLCSNADAFVARSFYGLFTTGSVVAFMTFGQMIDLKNTVVLLGYFKKRFIVTTIVVITIACFSWGLAINLLGRG